MNKLFIFLQLVVLIEMSISSEEMEKNSEWDSFKATYKKSYNSKVEEDLRMKIYKDNINKINEHNQLYELGKVSFTLKENQFADLLVTEFTERLNCFDQTIHDFSDNKMPTYAPSANIEDLENYINWTALGAVTEVKNQGQCGSCWAFSATGSLEGQHFQKTGQLISLSEQNLIDCCGPYYTHGCQGGNMNNAFKCITGEGGIEAESTYTYQAEDIFECRYCSKLSITTVTGYQNIAYGNEEALKSAVATVGPISVGIDAGHTSFQLYHSGIYYEPNCSSTALNHGVLIVGYGTEDGIDYWLIKNSWNIQWGINGYMKISRNRNNHCGMVSMASYPLV